MSNTSSLAHRENNFDFLRMVAASLVLYSHHFALTGRGEPSFFSLHSWGGFAVMIFFSISGYLVTQSWFADPHIGRFAARRVLRIWPALTIVVAAAALLLGPLVTRLPIAEYYADPGTWRYFHNLSMTPVYVLPGVFETNPYALGVNGSLWTIPIEVRCYILFGLMGAVGLWRWRWVLVAITITYAIWYFYKSSPDLYGKVNYPRELILYFFSGGAIFALKDRWQARPWHWLAGTLMAGLIAAASGFPYLGLSLALPYATILFGISSTPGIKTAGRYGDFSYGIYLFAYPTQQTVIHYLYPEFGFLGTLLLASGITLGLAVASWHLIEKRALLLKPKRKIKPVTTAPRPAVPYSKAFAYTLVLLLAAYDAYLVIFWPGILGEDGLAIMLEAETHRDFQSGKPIFWYQFVNLFYMPWRLTEIPIAVQLIVCAIVQSRILAWIYVQGMRRVFWFCLLFISLAPHLIFYNASLYSDGVYACALAGLLFEVWLALKTRRLSRIAIFILAICIPFAVFARPNGIINLIPVLLVLLVIQDKAKRVALLAVVAVWSTVALSGVVQYKQKYSIGTFLPVALWETVNFLQPHAMGLHPPRVTPLTIQTLEQHRPIPEILKFYDRDYWDPLWFFSKGPVLGAMTKQQKQTIVSEFFKHNLWANIPSFTSSRVHVFLVAAFAHGGFPGPSYAKSVLERTESNSVYRAWNLQGAEARLEKIHRTSFKHRWLLWTPFLGIGLTFWLCWLGWQRRSMADLVVSCCLLAQLLAIFLFSIAGEYRYLLGFFTAPLVLLPALLNARKESKNNPCPPPRQNQFIPS